MTAGPTKWIIASGLIGCLVAVVWLGAPLVPALVGAGAAALLLYRLQRGPRSKP